ncbi:Phospholipid/glycerol acyltransferase [Dillenia turbinata]|uniref:1-acylglycerol-3-phosphate O-acyltransferase n=1 Tax=Dillenia turbinata TaxID=194707 RepID=A0AAN8V8V2_9MAGN
MAVAAIVIVPVGLLFLLSGLIVNLLQAIVFILVRPISKNTYRRINKVVAELLWLELIWLVDWWAGVKIQLYMDSESYESVGKEHALVLCNHRSDIDWLVGWVLAQRANCLGSALAIMKKSAMFLPVKANKLQDFDISYLANAIIVIILIREAVVIVQIIGWSMWFSEYVFLERSWAKDETTLKSGMERLKDFPRPFWLALFVEGTRFTEAKLLSAQEYAALAGLPTPRNVLIPRTKGFVAAVSNMRSFVPAIYDCTLAVPRSQPKPTMLRILKGQSFVVDVQVRRHLMSELPETPDGIAQWCRDTFVTKDAVLERYNTKETFGGDELLDTGRPKQSLFVVMFWTCLLSYGMYEFFKWTSILETWEGIVFIVGLVALVTILMHILIVSSQSERSTPPKVSPKDPLKQGLLRK